MTTDNGGYHELRGFGADHLRDIVSVVLMIIHLLNQW